MEVTFSGTPMVVVYKVSPITYLIGKRLVKTPYIGMVNLIAGKQVVPELLQERASPKNIALEACNILENRELQAQMKTDLATVRKKLGNQGASERAAEHILRFLEMVPEVREAQS